MPRLPYGLRPEDKTWFEKPRRAKQELSAVGANPIIQEPTVTLIEESAADVIGSEKPRTTIINAEVVNPRCVDVSPSLFAVPKGYRHQKPIVAGPG